MSTVSPIRVFIGSGEASLLERKVAIYSLRKNTKSDLDIYVFNGTHNAVELNNEEPYLAPLSLRLKYRNGTEFSLYRYLIPQLCNHQGKAIYIDSDVICLTDIGDLFNTDLEGHDFLAKGDAYSKAGGKAWGLSVMLIDCEKSRFDLEAIFDDIDNGLYEYSDFSRMSAKFLQHHPYSIGELDPRWNEFDYYDRDTKLIHYTNLETQPWKHPHHPYGELWFRYFREAIASGYVTQKDIDVSLVRSYVRRDIMKGNSPLPNLKGYLRQIKGLARVSAKRILSPQSV